MGEVGKIGKDSWIFEARNRRSGKRVLKPKKKGPFKAWLCIGAGGAQAVLKAIRTGVPYLQLTMDLLKSGD